MRFAGPQALRQFLLSLLKRQHWTPSPSRHHHPRVNSLHQQPIRLIACNILHSCFRSRMVKSKLEYGLNTPLSTPILLELEISPVDVMLADVEMLVSACTARLVAVVFSYRTTKDTFMTKQQRSIKSRGNMIIREPEYTTSQKTRSQKHISPPIVDPP